MLQPASYDPDTATVELTATPDAGPIPLYQLTDLSVAMQLGTWDDRPLRAVRVVYLDMAAARAESGVLRDAGARVLAYDEQGALVEVDSAS